MITTIKTCFKCKRELPLTEFYKQSKMADGHLNKCKACTKADVSTNRGEKLDYYREYDIVRSKTPKRKALSTRVCKEFRTSNPEKYKAQNALNNAVRSGKVVKPDACWVCGGDKGVHGHHSCYDMPLAITWLCSVCHKAAHKIT